MVMNLAVYRHLLLTFGRRPGIWFGLVCELIRTILARVIWVIIVAHIVATMATGNIASARQLALLLFVTYASGAIIGTIGDLVAIKSDNDEYERAAVVYYRKIANKDLSFYRDHKTGYLVSLYRQYADSLMSLVRLFRTDIVRVTVSLTVPAIVLGIANWRLGLAAFAIILVQLVYIVWTSTKANRYRQRSHEIYRKVTGEVADVLTNIVAFKASGKQRQTDAAMAALAKEETHTFWLRRRMSEIFNLPRELITGLGVTIALLIALSGTRTSAMSTGLIVLTLTYMLQIIRNVSELPALMMQHDDLITKVYPTLAHLTDEHETIKDPPHPKKLAIKNGAIALNQVDFHYPAPSAAHPPVPVFRNLNVRINGGEHVGIVGLSGAGKSTLASLLMRFDEVTGGSITIDGTNIRDVRQNDLHQQIAYVPQEPLLFHRTIRENIAYGDPDADEQAVIRAAKAAHAHEFISRLPDGYDSMVGERGVKLSGGQKQRVVIARAILKNAPIIVLDEATSALDTESEKIIQRALPTIMGKHTALVIAHRLSTIAGMDRILVMHEGDIIEQGTHDQLLTLGGRYASLWQKQIQHE